MIGFTIIAFGTSLPEFVVSVNAAATGNPAIALGNVLGSNVANIALVLALCTLIQPDLIARTPQLRTALIRHAALMPAATVAFALLALLALRGVLDVPAGLILLLFAVFLVILWKERREVNGDRIETHGRKDVLFIVLGLAAVIIGSQLVLRGAVGTSLPELATSLLAASRRLVRTWPGMLLVGYAAYIAWLFSAAPVS